MEITGKVLIVLLAVFLVVATPWLSCHAQPQDEAARGIQLYRDGKMKEAVSVLGAAVKKQKDNPDAWNILGLAQYKTGDTKAALKSFENAIKLRPDFEPAHVSLAVILLSLGKIPEAKREAEQAIKFNHQSQDAHYVLGEVGLCEGRLADALKEVDAALKINDHFSTAWLLKTQTLLRLFTDRSYAAGKKSGSGQDGNLSQDDEERYEHYNLMAEAAASLESYLKLNQDAVLNEFWREQLEAMRFYIEWAGKKGTDPQMLSANKNLKPTVKYAERAKYTDEARQAGVKGKAIVKVEFASDGQLKHILVLQGLSHGLTQEAVRAARKMKFIPAMKDGQMVSVIANIEFVFSLY